MENVHCSYYKCLNYMGIPNNYKRPANTIYSEWKRRIYRSLEKAELNSNTIEMLIKSFNERVLKLEKKHNFNSAFLMNYRLFEYCDIRDHFVIANILFDMKNNKFDSNYTLYSDNNSKSAIFIGINGVDNQKLSIPDSVTKLINTNEYDTTFTIPKYPMFYSNKGAVRLNITNEGINTANERIERGIRTNWEATHSPSAIKFLIKNKIG